MESGFEFSPLNSLNQWSPTFVDPGPGAPTSIDARWCEAEPRRWRQCWGAAAPPDEASLVDRPLTSRRAARFRTALNASELPPHPLSPPSASASPCVCGEPGGLFELRRACTPGRGLAEAPTQKFGVGAPSRDVFCVVLLCFRELSTGMPCVLRGHVRCGDSRPRRRPLRPCRGPQAHELGGGSLLFPFCGRGNRGFAWFYRSCG